MKDKNILTKTWISKGGHIMTLPKFLLCFLIWSLCVIGLGLGCEQVYNKLSKTETINYEK